MTFDELPESIARPFRRLLDQLGTWVEENPTRAETLFWFLLHGTAAPDEGEPRMSFIERVSRRLVPANWWELPIGAQERARKQMRTGGICLIWVPRAEIVCELIAPMSKAERDAHLLQRQFEILADVEACLAEVEHPRLAELRLAGEEALVTFREGRLRAAQALSASLLGGVLVGEFGHARFDRARQSFEEDLKVGDMRTMRIGLIQTAISKAIEPAYDPPVSTGFNRHLTVHGVDATQYTAPHAIEALLLVAGTLRELQDLYELDDRGLPPVPLAVPLPALSAPAQNERQLAS
jgi:hypothetical protein